MRGIAAVAYQPHKLEVSGSNPLPAPNLICWHGAMVAHLTCNEVVVGSTPSASSNFLARLHKPSFYFLYSIYQLN